MEIKKKRAEFLRQPELQKLQKIFGEQLGKEANKFLKSRQIVVQIHEEFNGITKGLEKWVKDPSKDGQNVKEWINAFVKSFPEDLFHEKTAAINTVLNGNLDRRKLKALSALMKDLWQQVLDHYCQNRLPSETIVARTAEYAIEFLSCFGLPKGKGILQ